MRHKILLDTDIGTDIDDALCLAYLLLKPDCELLGITTVTGEPEKRAGMAAHLCQIAGQEVPIYSGIDTPLLVGQQQKLAQQAKVLGNQIETNRSKPVETLTFLQETIRDNPGEITLLTIGPLTNIGLLFAMDREIPSMLKSLVIMGGHFGLENDSLPKVEWNIVGDPHASAIVYNAIVPQHRSIGLDVTSQVTMQADEFRRSFQHELFEPIHKFAEIWFEYSETITFHDPLAAVSIFNDGVCNFRSGKVDIDLSPGEVQGRTFWNEGKGPHEVAMAVDAVRFFQEYNSVIK
ncbi:MAG: nucleoside hydrolase [Candidatus Marinimicrobia bacterium]|nr:nucleoside hydrolase [Candidatus Neomarinimicrobiota bacterium]MCF7850942.1 nucleoside hydrolase [Candidatus Neomarinimicrobiota bacterium]